MSRDSRSERGEIGGGHFHAGDRGEGHPGRGVRRPRAGEPGALMAAPCTPGSPLSVPQGTKTGPTHNAVGHSGPADPTSIAGSGRHCRVRPIVRPRAAGHVSTCSNLLRSLTCGGNPAAGSRLSEATDLSCHLQ